MSAAAEHLRQPPQSIEAEQNVVGGLLLHPAAFHKVADMLKPDDFYRRDHQLIYRAIVEINARTDAPEADWVVVGEWFDANGKAEVVENGSYLVTLASNTASAANIVAYAEIVRDKAVLRRLIDAGTEIVNGAYEPQGRDTHELLALASQRVNALSGTAQVGGPKGMKDVAKRWYADLVRRTEQGSALQGLPTPWNRLNKKTSGFKAGELIVVAGRPSMGKSAFAVNVGVLNAMRGKRVLFFNLEMTDMSIFNRAVAALMEIPLGWLREPSKDYEGKDYWSAAGEGSSQLIGSSLLIDDSSALSVDQIVARAQRTHMQAPVDMVIVDHLHLMPLPGKTRETVEIGHITRDLKGLAKKLGCPVLLLSQLNRSLEARTNKRPMLSDLRESGAIEQDADLIVFLYRDDYYAEKEERPSEYPGFVEIIIGKQREGETGKVWARDGLHFGRLDDYDGQAPVSNKPQQSQSRGIKA